MFTGVSFFEIIRGLIMFPCAHTLPFQFNSPTKNNPAFNSMPCLEKFAVKLNENKCPLLYYFTS